MSQLTVITRAGVRRLHRAADPADHRLMVGAQELEPVLQVRAAYRPRPTRFDSLRSGPLGPGRRLEIGHQLVTDPPETPRSMKTSRRSNHLGSRGLNSSWFCSGSPGGSLLISGSKVRVLDGPPIFSGASESLEAPELRLITFWFEGTPIGWRS